MLYIEGPLKVFFMPEGSEAFMFWIVHPQSSLAQYFCNIELHRNQTFLDVQECYAFGLIGFEVSFLEASSHSIMKNRGKKTHFGPSVCCINFYMSKNLRIKCCGHDITKYA